MTDLILNFAFYKFPDCLVQFIRVFGQKPLIIFSSFIVPQKKFFNKWWLPVN